MALTLNGRRTGRAGAMDLADFRDMLYEDACKRSDALEDRFMVARDALKYLDPAGWSDWYDQFVPDWRGGWLNAGSAITVMEARVDELLAAAFYGLSDAEAETFCELVEQENSHVLVVAQAEAVK